MESNRREKMVLVLLELIQDTHLFIKQQFHLREAKENGVHLFGQYRKAVQSACTPESPQAPSIEKVHLEPLLAALSVGPPVEPSQPLLSVNPDKKKVNKPATQVKKSAWELQPLAQAEDCAVFRKQIAHYVQTCDPLISVLLLLPEENPLHRLFLENVCRAITRTFTPASVVLFNGALLIDEQYKLVLAPCSLLKKKFPDVQPHQSFKTERYSVIPLENLDLYTHDVNSKRALWSTIQRSFQS